MFLILQKVSSWGEVRVEVKLVMLDNFMQLQLYMVVCGGGQISRIDLNSWVVLSWVIVKEVTEVFNDVLHENVSINAFHIVLQTMVLQFALKTKFPAKVKQLVCPHWRS
jgi:hypothetical protein